MIDSVVKGRVEIFSPGFYFSEKILPDLDDTDDAVK